jgi:uncharacterized protein GlcG (DUF336 family)
MLLVISGSVAMSTFEVQAQQNDKPAPICPVQHDQLADALKKSVKPSGGPSNGGLDNNEWAAVVNRDGVICAVAFSGAKADDQWPGSRLIAAEKANTANGFSLKTVAMSTANLYAGSQPGGPLYGIALTNLASPEAAVAGDAKKFGTATDPLIGKRLGGAVVFGGGLALYNETDIVGGLGASGDTSCADHNVAWRLRKALGLDHIKAGVKGRKNDGIIYDIGLTGHSKSGFGHPLCGGNEAKVATDIGAGEDDHLIR